MLWNYFHILPDQDECQLLYRLKQHFPLRSILSLIYRHGVLEWTTELNSSLPLIPPVFTAAFCLISYVHSKKKKLWLKPQLSCSWVCACKAAGIWGLDRPHLVHEKQSQLVRVMSVQQRYPARELKFQDNSLSETKSMYKSSSNINLSQAKLFSSIFPVFCCSHFIVAAVSFSLSSCGEIIYWVYLLCRIVWI